MLRFLTNSCISPRYSQRVTPNKHKDQDHSDRRSPCDPSTNLGYDAGKLLTYQKQVCTHTLQTPEIYPAQKFHLIIGCMPLSNNHFAKHHPNPLFLYRKAKPKRF